MVKECWSQQESTTPADQRPNEVAFLRRISGVCAAHRWRLCGASVAFLRRIGGVLPRISGVLAARRPQMFHMKQAFDKKRQGPVGRRSPVQCNHTPNKSLKMRLLSFSRPTLAACAGLVNPATLR